jgi:conserved oligomeric Golgi complex subunit 6
MTVVGTTSSSLISISSGALSDLAAVRQTTLLTSFITALTRGGPSGLPRPIELHAHDPIRYVGDMLAWVHQAMATEREFLDSLFGLSGEKRMVGSVWRNDQQSEEAGWVRDLMDRDLEKICTPLTVRSPTLSMKFL